MDAAIKAAIALAILIGLGLGLGPILRLLGISAEETPKPPPKTEEGVGSILWGAGKGLWARKEVLGVWAFLMAIPKYAAKRIVPAILALSVAYGGVKGFIQGFFAKEGSFLGGVREALWGIIDTLLPFRSASTSTSEAAKAAGEGDYGKATEEGTKGIIDWLMVYLGSKLFKGRGATPKEPPSTESSAPPLTTEQPEGKPLDTAPEEISSPPKKSYVNNNPDAKEGEIRVGELLHNIAQAGNLPGVVEVEGAPESNIPGERSGDYRFTTPDGQKISADLIQPETGNAKNLSIKIIKGKSGQCKVVVVELGVKQSATITNDQALKAAKEVINTPNNSIDRVIVIKDGKIIVDESR
jgi:hypothetical protein